MSDIEQESGWLLNVEDVVLGNALLGDHPAGATVLQLVDAVVFDETGGECVIGPDTLSYVSADLDADTITLAQPLAFALEDGETVTSYDTQLQAPAAELQALVEFVNDEYGDDDAVECVVSQALALAMPRGNRNGRGESVICQRDSVGSVWTVVDLQGSRAGLSKTDKVFDELIAIYDRADEAAEAADTAARAATTAQQAANGKNQVIYSLNGPGATINTKGDIWFQKDLATQTIIAQYEGLGGTSWQSVTLNSQVIANLDAGKLTAGSAFVNFLVAKSNLQLGDVNTDGVIQSFNFANSSTGVFINKQGIVAKGGSIAGAAITGGQVIGAIVRTASASTRVEISHGGNPFESNQTWGLVEFYNSNPAWAPGRIWGTYNASDPRGELVLASPYLTSSGIGGSARLALGVQSNGFRYLTTDASSYYFGSGGTSVDINLQGTNLFQIITPSRNEKVNINLGSGGTGFGAAAFVSQNGDGTPRQLGLGGKSIYLATEGARNLVIGGAFGAPASPAIIDAGAKVGISFRNVKVGADDGNNTQGTLDVCGEFGTDLKTIRAWTFVSGSDVSWKDEIRDAPAGMLDEIMAIRPVEYGVKGFDPETRRTRGLLAQDVRDAVPYGTKGSEEDDSLGVDHYVMLTTLVGALQESHREVRELTDRVDRLEDLVERLAGAGA